MARRDNQGLQIAMIVFILTTLVFIVTTYFGWNSSQKLQAQVNELESSLETERGGARRSAQLVETFKKFTGLASEVQDEAIEPALQKAVETYGQGLPVENQNYQDIAARMTAQIQDLNNKLAQASDTEQQLRDELAQVRETTAAIVAQAKAAESQAVADLNRVQQEAQSYQSKLDSERSRLAQQLDASKRAMTDLRSKTDTEVADINNELRQTKVILEDRIKQLDELQDPTPDRFDGRVVGVVAATGTVWLDVGRADGLQPKTSFSVFDADESSIRSVKRKASIEVTRILGDHRAEARITDIDYLNPIVRGDLIYSPVWNAGTKLGLALVGTMDIDRDNTDDRKYIRNLIQINGGNIDAEDVDGKVQGQMTVNTRYIVVGESVIEDGAQNPALTPMLDGAARLGVQRISLQELLDLMGFVGRARSVSFAGVVRPGDFAPEPREGVTRKSTGSSFEERSPVLRRRSTPAY